jgi:hypothetical protein
MRRFVLALALVVAVAACGGSAESTKYKQSWTKPYPQTTCTDFYGRMDAHQQFVMTADYLLTWQRKTKPDAPIPSDDAVNAFMLAFKPICQAGVANSVDQLMDGVAQEAYARGNFGPS